MTESAVLRILRRDLERAGALEQGQGPLRTLACLLAPGTLAVAVYRLGHWALGLPSFLRLVADPLYWLLNGLVKVLWGIEISRHARIGPGLYIGHFGGIVVGKDVIMGANCNLSQQVTIGVAGRGAARGAPMIGDDVYIAPGAKVFGKISVGNNVKIGANAVVHADVPHNAIVALDPGFRIVSYKGNRNS